MKELNIEKPKPMKHLLLVAGIGIALLSPEYICSQENPDQTVIIQFEEWTKDEIMEVYSTFNNDEEFRIINSCDALGMVVFQRRPQSAVWSKSQCRSYIDVRLKSLRSAQVPEIIEDLTAAEVRLQCRQAVQQQVNPQGN